MKTAFLIRKILSNIFWKIDTLLGLNSKSAIVLCYHSFSSSINRYNVAPYQFAKQMANFQKYFNFASSMAITNFSQQTQNQKPKILLTIDDGFASVINILPITKKLKIPVLLFVLSEPERANKKELDSTDTLLTWEQISDLHHEGWEIGCHSATHADFSQLTESEIKNEIHLSKKKLEKKLGFKITSFAYPKGFCNQNLTEAVKAAGYTRAFTIEAGQVKADTNYFEIPRTIVDQSHELTEIPAIVTTSWLKFRKKTNSLKLWEKFLK